MHVFVASQGVASVRLSGGAAGYGLFRHGQLGRRLGCHHAGWTDNSILWNLVFIKWGLSWLCTVCVHKSSGGVFGAAVVGPILQNLWRVPVAGGEGVAVVWSQIQPPGSTNSVQPEQWLHPHLPAVPRLCPPGETAHPPSVCWSFHLPLI